MSNVTTLAALREPTQHQNAMTAPSVQAGFFDLQSFELMQRVAKGFASSSLVPKDYQGNVANTMIALSMAQRIGADPMAVMQQLYIVHGRPSWSSKFLIATFNACGRFTAMRFRFKGEEGSDDWACQAYATEKATGEEVNGSWVSIKLAKDEGWHGKNGSKWKTMPQQMLMYRAASFMVNIVAPELSMGLQTAEEAADIIDVTPDSYRIETLRGPSTEPTAHVVEQQDQTDPAPSDQDEADSSNSTEWPQANAETGELIDVRGIAWDKRIHSTAKKCNDDGTWCPRRGVDPRLITKLEREAMEAAVKARNAELPLGGEPAATDPHPTEDWGATDQPDDTKPLTYEQIREGMSVAKDQEVLDAWAEESRHVVITQSQRATLDLVYDQRMRQLTAPGQNAA